MAENDLQIWVRVEHSREHQPDRLRCRLDRVAPGRTHHQGEVLGIVLVVDFRHLWMRQRGMEINRHVELFGALIDRPEFLEVEELTIRHPVQHRAFEAEFGDRALELIGSRLGIHGREGGESCETLGIGRAHFGEAVIHLPGQIGGDVRSKLLGGRCAMREHLDVDPRFVHLLEAQTAQVIEPLIRLIATAGFGTGEMLGQFRVPVMLLDGNDRTIRLFHHDATPQQKWSRFVATVRRAVTAPP